MPVKAARNVARGATRVYTTGLKTIGKTTNALMKPVTRSMTKIAKKAPVVGGRKGLLPKMVSIPRRVTGAAVAAGLAVPRAAGRIAGTGVEVIRRAMFDPLIAMGGGAPLVVLGLSPSGKPKRITGKKSAKKSRARK